MSIVKEKNSDKGVLTDLVSVANPQPASSKKIGKCFNIFGKTNDVAETNPILSAKMFQSALNRERHRADRNGHGFSLVGFDLNSPKGISVDKFVQDLASRSRVTDEIGWFDNCAIGILLFNTPEREAFSFAQDVAQVDTDEQMNVDYNVWAYPSDWGKEGDDDDEGQSGKKTDDEIAVEDHGGALEKGTSDQRSAICGNTVAKKDRIRHSLKSLLFQGSIPSWKRTMDIGGAFFGLIFLSPIFLFIAFFIKMVSPGPVIFKQERVGFDGKRFTLWKFRTMHVNNDTSEHQAALAEMIHSGDDESSKKMVKLDDKRTDIIRFGRLLRKTCIDEFPQLVNVLRGEMSLVGPRPPIPYEAKEYLRWHKGRFDTVPGMTGLWQVSGKNNLTFNEMARLDIQYSRNMSLWLDVEILARTPLLVVSQSIENL